MDERKLEEKQKKVSLFRTQKLWDKIVLVDGLGRSGKSVLLPVLASFKDFDMERIEFIYDKIAVLSSLGKITKDAAVILLQTETDSKLYESQVGRNMNFRFSDHSSVFHNPSTFELIRRLFKKDGLERVDDILRKKPVFQIMTHNILGSIDIFFDAFDDNVKILEIVKHPIDQVYSQYKRGWGSRQTNDPRSTEITVKSGNGAIPWPAIYVNEDYNAMEPLDRIISINEVLLRRNLEKYKELEINRKNQIMWILFDDFVTHTEKNLKYIEDFVGKKRTVKTKLQLKKERCPRILIQAEREKREQFIRSNAHPDSLKKLENIFSIYKNILKLSSTQLVPILK
jgi:hypothetical protein